MTLSCTACSQPIPAGLAVLRGNAHELKAWCRDCFTVTRAVAEIDVPAIAATIGPLTRRLVAAGIL